MFHVKPTPMNEKLMTCPLCGGKETTLFLDGLDYFFTGQSFQIVTCLACGFRYTNPRPTEESSAGYYQSDEYISHDTGTNDLMTRIYALARHFTVQGKYNLVRKYSPGKSLLDIGCGTGEFLNYCQNHQFNCVGVEPSDKARTYAQTNYHLEIREQFLQGMHHSERFDCITLWHVLEHIHQLDATLVKIRTLLKPGGTAIIALPNSNSYDAGYYRQYWAAYDLPRHLYHFNRFAVTNLAEKHHFTLLEVLPQKLDVYYIALLSEKYKGSHLRVFKAFFRGMISNIVARDPKRGYSSQIYILKPKIS